MRERVHPVDALADVLVEAGPRTRLRLMSLLPCDGDLRALGVLDEDGYWDMDALREHVQTCESCECIRDAFASVTYSMAGRAGKGKAKRRGDTEYYRRLAAKGRNGQAAAP